MRVDFFRKSSITSTHLFWSRLPTQSYWKLLIRWITLYFYHFGFSRISDPFYVGPRILFIVLKSTVTTTVSMSSFQTICNCWVPSLTAKHVFSWGWWVQMRSSIILVTCAREHFDWASRDTSRRPAIVLLNDLGFCLGLCVWVHVSSLTTRRVVTLVLSVTHALMRCPPHSRQWL